LKIGIFVKRNSFVGVTLLMMERSKIAAEVRISVQSDVGRSDIETAMVTDWQRIFE
jgi:hypothetical protein